MIVQDRGKGKPTEIAQREGDERTTEYFGSATSYESFGVQCISKRLKAKGIDVGAVIKDGDSNALTVLQTDFPNITNILDKNHYIKNIPKNVSAATSKAPELKGHQLQIQQQVNRILTVVHRHADRDLEWRKGLFSHLGEQMVHHLSGKHSLCPPPATTALPSWGNFDLSSAGSSVSSAVSSASFATTSVLSSLSTESSASSTASSMSSATLKTAGFTTFRGEKIDLFWHCHCAQAEADTLLPPGEDSKKWKYKVIRGEGTKKWLSDFIKTQASRDEIMFPGSSNINESIHNAYTVKANKRYDFRFAKVFCP